jgi:hypothetical protein
LDNQRLAYTVEGSSKNPATNLATKKSEIEREAKEVAELFDRMTQIWRNLEEDEKVQLLDQK